MFHVKPTFLERKVGKRTFCETAFRLLPVGEGGGESTGSLACGHEPTATALPHQAVFVLRSYFEISFAQAPVGQGKKDVPS